MAGNEIAIVLISTLCGSAAVLIILFYFFAEIKKPTETKTESYKQSDYRKAVQQFAEEERLREELEAHKRQREQEEKIRKHEAKMEENNIKESLLQSLESRARTGDVNAFEQWKSLRNSK